MINFFRKIRKQLADDNKPVKYMRYAVGEILLVVIGILIALSINNWNEERKRQMRFNFGVKELYNQIRRDYLYDFNIEDKAAFQVALMERILKGDNTLIPEHIPGIIQLLDDNFELDGYSVDYLESFLEFNPNNEEHNELARSVRKYSSDRFSMNNMGRTSFSNSYMSSHLKKWNIPLRVRHRTTNYPSFIENYSEKFYSEKNLNDIKDMIKEESFIADLKSLLDWKKTTLISIAVLNVMGESQMTDLKNYYPNIDFGIPKIEVIGATTYNSWGKGLPMQNTSNDDSVWEVVTNLSDGLIKFRTDGGWTFDWGRTQTGNEELVFKGADIEVKQGHYQIILNISENTYKLIPISN